MTSSRMSRAGTGCSGGPRILVVRLSSMGDLLHALPAVATLKSGFPGSELTWVVRPRWMPLLEGNPYVDRQVPLDRTSFRGIAEAWKGLRSVRYDFVVDFQGLFQSAIVASLARGADRIYGFDRSQVRERVAAALYSHKVHAQADHVVDRNLELAAATGAAARLVTFPLPEGEREGDLPPQFVLANPLAGWAGKQWPFDRYRRLAAMLRRELGLPLVLNVTKETAASLGAAGETLLHASGLPGLIWATRRAAAVLGTDSGPMHLGAALGRPGVAIFGPTDPARNGPYGDTFTVLRSPDAVTTYKRASEPDPGMRAISPEMVLEALAARIAQGHSLGCSSA
jgi:heptosyltransferase-1